MNINAIKAIYCFEMARARRTLMQSVASPVLSTSLYFVVFGTAIGTRIGRDRRNRLWGIYYPWPADIVDTK